MTEIIIKILTILAVIVAGALITIRISKKRTNKSHQENITISGEGNKIVGGDDNSKN